jgi:hypothetical protein
MYEAAAFRKRDWAWTAEIADIRLGLNLPSKEKRPSNSTFDGLFRSVWVGAKGGTTLTKSKTTSSKTGRPGHLNTLHIFRKIHEFIFKQLMQYSAFVWMRFRS